MLKRRIQRSTDSLPMGFLWERLFLLCGEKKRRNVLTNISIYSNICIQKVVLFQDIYRKRERRLNYVDKQRI